MFSCREDFEFVLFANLHLLPKKVFLQREKYDEELEESRLCFLLCSYLQEKSREQGRADLSWLPSGGCCSPMPTPGLDSRAETHSSGRKRQKENLFDVLHFQKEMLLLKWFCGWNHNVSKLGCLGSQALLHQAFFHLPTCLQRQMLPLQPGGANMLFDCKYWCWGREMCARALEFKEYWKAFLVTILTFSLYEKKFKYI